jgi:hypothetical protein
MSIAVLGWGSLIWSGGNLGIKTKWRSDGPVLPIEFARVSQDNRLTLVIQPGSADQPTYWALSQFSTVSQACENLRAREGSNSADIHFLSQDGSKADRAPQEIVHRVRKFDTYLRELRDTNNADLRARFAKKMTDIAKEC